jgi:hypothetical protein
MHELKQKMLAFKLKKTKSKQNVTPKLPLQPLLKTLANV